MQKTRINGKKFVQSLVKVTCETDFPVMLFLAVANGNVVRAVFCFIAIFKIKAHIRRSGTSRNNQRQSQSGKHSESHLEEHPAFVL